MPRGEFSVLLAGIAAAAGLAEVSAAIAGAVLALSLLGTVGMRYAPQIALRAFPRRASRLEERGFRADLAMHDPPSPPVSVGAGDFEHPSAGDQRVR